jgi:uncharacterized protein YbjQ (UPF0145 family)
MTIWGIPPEAFLILALLILGFSVGGFRERRHFKNLALREAAASDMLVTNLKQVANPETVRQSSLVGGQVVIGTDYFKTIATGLRNLVGGEMKAAQSLMVRARREAVLRMIEDARRLGATEVCNVRFAFCNISMMSGNKGAMSVEVYAYGTAVVRG